MATTSGKIRDLLDAGRPSFSFEFFPPKTEEGERLLWQAIRELEGLQPTFVSVTYGAGGSTRDTTVDITSRIGHETSMLPMAHLTCVGHTKEELDEVLTAYADAGVANVMLLRGDPQEGPRAAWTATEGGFAHAVELVELAASRGNFSIGVAAFPEGHPTAESLEHDAQVLVDKARAGAEFAVTQMFFDAGDYFSLVERVRAHGADLPILPGIMPILNLNAITRQGELIGTSVPDWVVRSFDGLTEPAEIRANGIRLATQLCQDLLDGGAPGLHFYTLNRSKATREIFEALRITV
jgi:methylenetetrahydrofolate reductase (NADPH)